MSRSRAMWKPALLLCALALATGAGIARAEVLDPAEGAWKGKTSQGYPIYFGVEAGAVRNVRLTIRDPICGKNELHRRGANLSIDESGDFSGVLVPNRVEIEGTFSAPERAKGTIVSLETTGLPGCLRKVAQFSARPR
jgi:hypothetical protein